MSEKYKMGRREFMGLAATIAGAAVASAVGISSTAQGSDSTSVAPNPMPPLTAEQLQNLILSGEPLYANPVLSPELASSVPPVLTAPNIILVVVDELFLPIPEYFAGGLTQGYLNSNVMPNIAWLQQNSYSFQQHFTAASMCTPARSTIITGLYTPQTRQYLTESNSSMPALDDRYPTIGNAIQIVAPAYEGNSTYIGKFHLANYSGSLTGGTNPYAPYGFGYNYYQSPTMPPHGLPLTYLYPSPIGDPNEGEQAAGGGGYPLPPSTPTAYNMSDPDIVNAFVQWFEARPKANPWLTVVGLVNPHDVQFYPNGYHNYKAITSFPATYPPEVTPLSAYTSFPFTTEDVASPSVAALKPGLQSYFLNFGNTQYGAVGAVEGSSWTDFMNYYLAVIANVDASVGVILNNVTVAANERAACPSPTGDLNNTVVIFTSDHADYAGAHGLHGKGGAVYEEALRVPLYVHFPNQRNQHCGGNYAGFQRNQLTSSVDLFALIMDLGTTGTSQWRTEYFPDQKARQSLYYYLYHPNATETRIIPATGSLIDGFPYVVTTTDEDFGLKGNPGSVWRHVACLRTKSPTTQPNGSDSPPNANLMGLTNPAKLATYNLWDQDNPANEAGSVTQYEFYDYVNAGNTRELLNDSEKTSPTVVSGTGASQTLLTDMVNALGSEYVGVAATGLFATELNSALTGQAVKLSATGQWEIDSGTDLATVQSDATSNYETYEHS